jgi:Leucine-rich repeat (LRR) protein
MSGNRINSIETDTFIHSTALECLDLKGNNITHVHPSVFRNNIFLRHLDMSGNRIDSIETDTFIHNTALEWLHLNGNNITDVHPSTFRHNSLLMHYICQKIKSTQYNHTN